MGAASTYDAILDAAEVVVRRDGTAGLTLEAVAAEAGVSKGGLLYHFKSKDALVAGMVARMNRQFAAAYEAGAALDADLPGARTRAYLRAMVGEERPPEKNLTGSALLAAIALAPSLIDPLREQYAQWRDDVAHDDISPEDAAIVMLAADGLWMADVLGFAPPTGEARRRILERLLELAGRRR